MRKSAEKSQGYLLLAYMAGSGAFLFSIGTTFNGGFWLTVKYLALPLGIALAAFTYARSRALERHMKLQVWLFVMLMLFPIVVLMAWPYVLAANALVPSGAIVAVSGVITSKSASAGRSTFYVVTVRDPNSGNEDRIQISRAAYEVIAIGDSYKFCFYDGRFGIPFYWRLSGPPEC